VWVIGLVALGLLAWGLGTGAAVPGAEQRNDANLVATRGNGLIRRWIVAHVDSKAQGHSMAGRLVAVWVLILTILLGTGLVLLRVTASPVWSVAVAGLAGMSLAAGFLARQGRLRGTSPGARDNGTGLLAALVAADGCTDPEIGFLFTGAEEFGLVGARIAAQGQLASPEAEVVNLDTLDQVGSLYLVYHGSEGMALADRLRPQVEGIASKTRVRRLPMGILTDSLPFARLGRAAITIGRLDWATLRRIHTPRDTADGLELTTAVAVGQAVLRR
jgi:peptidase M28-like protein